MDYSTELKMTEWKITVHISSSSQISIAALKNVLADGRFTSSPPLPLPHHTPSFAPTNHPYTLSLYLLGQSVGEPEGVGGEKGSRACQSPVS